MAINTDNINVLNYNSHVVIVKTKTESFSIPAAEDDTTPGIVPFSLADLVYVNGQSAVFRNGTLRFEEDVAEEVYTALKIRDWQNIMSNEEIEEILRHPTVTGLQKFVDIKDSAAFERVRAKCTELTNAGADISIRVKQVVQRRYEELRVKRIKSDIMLTPKAEKVEPKTDEKISELEAKLAAQSAQMEQLLAMMAQMQSAQTNAAVTTAEAADTTTTAAADSAVASETTAAIKSARSKAKSTRAKAAKAKAVTEETTAEAATAAEADTSSVEFDIDLGNGV